ncbi:hypothetical protein AHAS_Ahas01G0124600 [Arachis hypogaea]
MSITSADNELIYRFRPTPDATQQPLSEFGFQCHNLSKQPLSYRCNSLELMIYANITSVSKLYLTGERLSLANVCSDNLCKQPLSYRCDNLPDWSMYLWKANLGGLTTISLLVFSR